MGKESVIDPARMPRIKEWLAAANAELRKWQSTEGRLAPQWQTSASQILASLLTLSEATLANDTAPTISMRKLSEQVARDIDHRAWASFVRWYRRHIEPEMNTFAKAAGMPPLHPHRHAPGPGGRGEKNQATYFLALGVATYLDPPRQPSRKRLTIQRPVRRRPTRVEPFVEGPGGIRLHISADCNPQWLNKVLLG